jgi:hypothetical protein
MTVWSNPPSFIARHQVCSRTPTGLVTDREAVGVHDDEARGGAFLDIPRRWEAAGGHQVLRIHSRAANRTINAPGTTRAKTNAKNQPETVRKFEVSSLSD